MIARRSRAMRFSLAVVLCLLSCGSEDESVGSREMREALPPYGRRFSLKVVGEFEHQMPDEVALTETPVDSKWGPTQQTAIKRMYPRLPPGTSYDGSAEWTQETDGSLELRWWADGRFSYLRIRVKKRPGEKWEGGVDDAVTDMIGVVLHPAGTPRKPSARLVIMEEAH